MPRPAGNTAKAERDQLRDDMRALDAPLPNIAAEMSRQFNLRPRIAWRYALDWSQWKLALRYNTAHPGAKLSDSRVSEYELWPHGGSPLTLRYLSGLAITYGHGCTPLHLVDADDLRHLVPDDRRLLIATANTHPPAALFSGSPHPHTPTPTLAIASPAVAVPSDTGLVVPDASELAAVISRELPDALAKALVTYFESWAPPGRDVFGTPRERDRAYDRFVQFLSSWAHTMDRRNALRMLGLAASAASLSLPAIIDGDEQHRVVSVISTPSRVDTQTIEHIEAVLGHCERQDDVLGPRAVLATILAQRDLARELVPECPPALRPRMLSALSEASRQAGWASYDLNLFDHADYYYEDARAVAHEAGNIGLGAFVLCQMSQLATWQGKPHIGIDHAVMAELWAHRTDDILLRAFAADMAARAYAADGQRDACLAALDTAHTTLTTAGDHTPSHIPSYDEALHISFRGECHLKLHEGHPAAEYCQQSLTSLDQSFTRATAFATVHLGMAHAQCKEVDEAARLLGDAGDIAARNSSARLTERLQQARAMLQPWEHTTAVRQLDDRLASYSLA
jgi:hypothetical protein